MIVHFQGCVWFYLRKSFTTIGTIGHSRAIVVYVPDVVKKRLTFAEQ